MVRKRSLALLYEDDTSLDRNRNSGNRSISNILDPRTKVIHDLFNESSEISIESFQNQQEIEKSKRIDESSSSKSTTLM
ncbi:hypothetical protein Glove_547g7 [Diversispora epigaea]|uniref:Uncharacterized protein n=1 Tax=Diversispora epigaea TaxID=1348612 RepID=A0A397GDJ1_9GLOM|nr:hypothetical protein Glove_547g7 [Diversispora epigaea]